MIKDVIPHILDSDLQTPFAFSQAWYRKRRCLIVEIVTDGGTVGWGECFGPPAPIAAIIEEFKPLLIGEDAQAIERIWESLYNRSRDYGQKGLALAAISGIDIALWDALGKRYGAPVHALMGGPIRTEVPVYATGLYLQQVADPVALFRTEAANYINAGFCAIKMKVGFGIDRDIELIHAVRESIGPDIDLMIDANHAYDAISAVYLGRRIQDLDVAWFEEPVPPEDLAGYREVKAALDIPIAGGESACTRFGFRDILVDRVMDIIQPDICLAGGLSECRKIAGMASAFGVRCNPHVWGTGIALAATLQLLAILPHNPLSLSPTEPMLEFDQTEHPVRRELLVNPIEHHAGRIAVPDGPGLGIEVDREVLRRYELGTDRFVVAPD